VPYLLVAGDREVEARQISVRDRKGNDLGTQGLDDLILRLQDEVERKV
jgi:threonyl-tRNA synthetase